MAAKCEEDLDEIGSWLVAAGEKVGASSLWAVGAAPSPHFFYKISSKSFPKGTLS